MPIYVYQATETGCDVCSQPFEVYHSIKDTFERCEACDGFVRKKIMPVATSFPAGPSALRNMGMARLEKRSDGSYENVSAQPGAQRTGSLESFSKSLTEGPKPIIRS